MVLVFGIGVETSMFMRMSTFVLALCLRSCCIILSHCIDARVVNDFALDFSLMCKYSSQMYTCMCPYIGHSIRRMTFASMCDTSICDKIGTGKGLCLVSSLFPDPFEFLPTLPRYHQGAIDLRWLLR